MADNLRDWYNGVPSAPKKPHSTKPLTFMNWQRNDGTVPPPVTPQFGAFDGKSTFGQNWGMPVKNGFNSTEDAWNNPAVNTFAFKGTGIPSNFPMPAVRNYSKPQLPVASQIPAVPADFKSMTNYGMEAKPTAWDNARSAPIDWKNPINYNLHAGLPTNPLMAGGSPGMDTYAADQAFADQSFMDGMKGVSGIPTSLVNTVAGAGAKAPGFMQGDFMKGMLGTKDAPGWGGMALGAANSLLSGYMGMKQYGLAQDSFDESKNQFWSNFNVQKELVNNDINDRNVARNASRQGASNPYTDTKRIA